jgi:HEPN domain-containing protein
MLDIYSIIEDIRFRTSLLESLEWDEDLLKTFLIYFDGEIRNGNSVENLLKDIKDNFGDETLKIIIDIIKEEALTLDEYLNNDKGEH